MTNHRKHIIFLITASIIIAIGVAYRIYWIEQYLVAEGEVIKMQEANESEYYLGMKSFPVISFVTVNKDTVVFKADPNYNFQEGEKVKILYHEGYEQDAIIYHYWSVWFGTTIIILVCILLIGAVVYSFL